MVEEKPWLAFNITSASIVRLAIWLVAFWFLYLIRDLILVILVSVVIASAVEPAVRLFGRFRVPRTLAVLIIYLLAFALFFSLVPLFFIPIVGDLVDAFSTLPVKIGALSFLADSEGFFSTFAWSDYLTNFSANLQSAVSGLSSGLLQTLSFIFGGFFSFILVVVVSFYLAVQKDGTTNFLRLISPAKYESYIINLWRRAEKKIGLWMQGQILLGLLVGVLVYLGLTILQIDYALTLALMAALFELIPIFGPILAAVPAVLLGFADSATSGLLVVGFYVVIQQFENHLLHPLVVQKIVGVPPIVAILSLVVGFQLAGFVGILLAVPAATILMELLSDFEQQKQKREA